MADTPIIDESKLNALGQRLFNIWPTYVADRKMIEERWLRNLRQVRGIYDPEVKIPADRSRAYPKMTAWLVRGTIARLMQLLFPLTEDNWGVKASPLPDLSTEQLQEVLDALVAGKGGDPAQVQLTDAEIEKAILAFAAGKAERMAVKLRDDLAEMEFITLARKVVRSAVIYNVGVLEGPLHTKVKSRTWQQNVNTGKWMAVEVDSYKPLFEFLPVWAYYPDMTAASLDKQDGTFTRRIQTRAEVTALADRNDFLGDRIDAYLRKNEYGNYHAQWWEEAIKAEPKSAQAGTSDKQSRKFEVLSYWGGCTGHELRAAGVTIPDAKLGDMYHANVWMIDDVVIKARLAPLGEEIRHFHEFVFEDDDLSILGNGQCDVLRDSQMSLCETIRAALDNASVIGPACEINTDMVTPGQDLTIRKHMTVFRESNGGQSDAIPAMRNVNIDSHLSELMPFAQMFLTLGEKESGLPPASLGDTSGGGSEALRTSKNASMFLGAAALPIRDTVRNFDTFTISMINALVAWNKKFAPNASRDGDMDVIARGSTSLIAKEVLAQSLAEFRTTITPDEAPHVKSRGLLVERAKANDIPIDLILEDEDKANEIIAAQQQAQQSQLQSQQGLVEAQIKELLTRALEHEAKAQSEGASVGVSVFQAMIDAINTGHKASADKAKTLVAAHSADTARMQAEKPVPARAAA
jgi:hypothetical protein